MAKDTEKEPQKLTEKEEAMISGLETQLCQALRKDGKALCRDINKTLQEGKTYPLNIGSSISLGSDGKVHSKNCGYTITVKKVTRVTADNIELDFINQPLENEGKTLED